MSTGSVDPYRNFRFRVEIDGIQSAAFSDATISDSTTDPVEYREGTDAVYPRKLSTLAKYGNVTLKRGITTNMDLYNWRQLVISQGTDVASTRKNVTVTLMDSSGADKVVWNLYNTWPTKYSTGDLSAKGSDVLVETLELVVEYMVRTK